MNNIVLISALTSEMSELTHFLALLEKRKRKGFALFLKDNFILIDRPKGFCPEDLVMHLHVLTHTPLHSTRFVEKKAKTNGILR